MKILIACEFSGRVRESFRRRGHEVMSVDFLPSDLEGPHYQGDIRDVIDDSWDMLIAFPPCTYLASSGARWWKDRIDEQNDALNFIRYLMNAPIKHIAIENPIGAISTRIREPDQIIQPWQFGEGETKATCLWLKNLPELRPTNIVPGRTPRVHLESPSPDRWKRRSLTYWGIAEAMAEQWSNPMEISNRRIAIGDNLPILRSMENNSIKMVYLDPPFNSKRNYTAPKGTKAEGASFKDTWNLCDIDPIWIDEINRQSPASSAVIDTSRQCAGAGMQSYLVMIAIRLIEIKRLLRPDGSMFLHCDSTAVAYLKMLCDAMFGIKHFKNDVIWQRSTTHNDARQCFGRITDTILFYGYRNLYTDNIRIPYDEKYIKSKYCFQDERGYYAPGDLTAHAGEDYRYEFHGHNRNWRYPRHRLIELEQDNRIHFPGKVNGLPCLKRYLHDMKGKLPTNLWSDIPLVKSTSTEGTGYPTQKPVRLMERLILATTEPGDMVLDPFMGSGTTLIAAEQLKRQWFGIDLNPIAGNVTATRLREDCGLIESA